MAVAQEKPPPIRDDLEIHPQYYRGELRYVVRDPVSLNYFRLGEVEYLVLQCFQEGMDVEQTQKRIHERMGIELPTTEIYKFAHQLRSSNMLKSKGMEDARRLAERKRKIEKNKFKKLISNYLFVTIPLWDPDEFLDKLLPYFRLLLNPLIFLCWLALAGTALWIIATNFSTLVADAFSLLSGWNLLILSAVVFSVKLFHELGHAFTCKHFGGEVHAIGPAFLVFQPAMFTDASDAWQFSSKWARMGVTAAGLFTEIFLASVAAIVWLTSDPGLIKQISYTTMVVCTVHSVMFNGNPLLRFDGYYILSDLVEIPNLRQKASRYLGSLFDRYCLGVEEETGPPVKEKDKHTLVIYGLLRGFYRIFIILSIGFFLYSLFAPLGIFMWVSSAYGMIIMPVYKHGKQLARHYRGGSVKMHYIAVLVLVVLGVGGLFMLPIPYTIKAPCVVVPEQLSILRAPAGATVEQVLVEEGQDVKKGQLLARLRSPELMSRKKSVKARIKETEARMRKNLGTDMAEYKIQRQEKDKLEQELTTINEKIDQLTIEAPHAGVTVNVHRAEAKSQPSQHQFVPFPPKDPHRELSAVEGRQVTAGTGVVGVARRDNIRLRAYIYEYDLSYVSGGAEINSLLRTRPENPFESRVEAVTPVDVDAIDNVGITLADVGYIPVKPTKEGKKKPLITLYRLQTELIPNDYNLALGLTGKSRIKYDEGPAGVFYFNQIVRALRLRLQKI